MAHFDAIEAAISIRNSILENEDWNIKEGSGREVYAVVMAHPDTFVKSEGLIRLMI